MTVMSVTVVALDLWDLSVMKTYLNVHLIHVNTAPAVRKELINTPVSAGQVTHPLFYILDQNLLSWL